RHTRLVSDWSSDVCSSDLSCGTLLTRLPREQRAQKWQDDRRLRLTTTCRIGERMRSNGWRCLLARGDQHFFNVLPIHQVVEKCLEIVGPPIAVINIIRVLPNVAAKDWRRPVHERVFAIGCLANDQFAVFYSEPGPSGAELGHA